jgi:hypothetical protein
MAHKSIVNPLFREVPPRRAIRAGGRRPRAAAAATDSGTESDGDSRRDGFGANVQTLEKDKAYLLAKFGEDPGGTREFVLAVCDL